jgi:hypothetical protein
MMAEDETQVQETVTLPANLPNNPAAVEIWYQKYVPAGHLVVDIEPIEAVEDDMPTDEEPIVRAATAEETAVEADYEGIGDSLDYIGKDEPRDEAFASFEPLTKEDENGGTVIDESDNSPKEEGG